MGERDEQFRRFVVERSPGLLRLAYLLAPDPGAAEDLLQSALVRAYQRWRRIRDNPEGYVRRVLVTVAADERRRAHHRREIASAHLPEAADPAEPFADIDGQDRLRRAL